MVTFGAPNLLIPKRAFKKIIKRKVTLHDVRQTYHFSYKEVDIHIYNNCENEKLIFLSFMYIKYHPLFSFPSLDPL